MVLLDLPSVVLLVKQKVVADSNPGVEYSCPLVPPVLVRYSHLYCGHSSCNRLQ